MKSPAFLHSVNRALAMGVAAAIGLLFVEACKPAAPPAGPAPKKAVTTPIVSTNSPAKTNSEEFVSAFNDVLPPDKGKDPFYPSSTRRLKVVTPVASPNVVVKAEPLLVLKGTSKGRFAIINNAELELGEEQGVRTANGRVAVKLWEIGDDYVTISVRGETGKRKLMLESKRSHENH